MVGIALSSITVLMIQKIGWRSSYCAIGAFGLLSVLAGTIGLKNPKKVENVQADIDEVILKDESFKEKPKIDRMSFIK